MVHYETLDLDAYPLWHGPVPMTQYARTMGSPGKFLVSGDGCWVEDAAGRRLLDARAGMCNVNLGYSRTDIAEAMHHQALKLPFAPIIRFDRPADITVQYASELVAASPPEFTRVRFTQMGSASLENALLMARLYFRNLGQPEKRTVLSLRGSFHGTTYLTMSATGEDDIHELYEPMADGFVCVERPTGDDDDIESIRSAIEEVGAEKIAAIVVEPVMGSEVIPLPAAYLKALRELCDLHEIIFIFDEVVTAFGRLGAMYASDYFGVIPDILCLAKGITAGYAPLGAVLVREFLYRGFDREGAWFFANGSSTDGHPVACAAGLATLKAYQESTIIEDVTEKFGTLQDGLSQRLKGHPLAAEVRGCGALLGIQVTDQGGERATLAMSKRIRQACDRRGVLVQSTSGVVIIQPPLIISDAELSIVADTVVASFDELAEHAHIA